MTRRRSLIVLLACTLFIGLLVPAPSGAEPETIDVGTIGPDQSLFWDGGYVGYDPTYSLPLVGSSSSFDRCDNLDPCFIYRLNVTGTGQVLRIAFDTPMRDDGFEITIVSPSGTPTRKANSNQYSNETFLINDPPPEPGIWTIRVAPYSAEYAAFRMRAKLESVAYQPPPDANGFLLPNLRATRMWEFGWAAPANPFNGVFPPDDVNPPLEAAGQRPLSCAADEIIEEGAQRCLRFSFGLANVGDGLFDVQYREDRTGAEYDMTQCLQHISGNVVPHSAGKGAFHKTHGHAHYLDIIEHKLFRVTDRGTGAMIQSGTGKKLGYSPANQTIAEWNKFVQAPAGGNAGNCIPAAPFPARNNRLGMSRGWGDAYRYQRPGNYVEFAGNGDGWYVLQTIADPLNNVLETNENDNISYAYLRIVGEDINVLESGVGTSPWDPNKVLFD